MLYARTWNLVPCDEVCTTLRIAIKNMLYLYVIVSAELTSLLSSTVRRVSAVLNVLHDHLS